MNGAKATVNYLLRGADDGAWAGAHISIVEGDVKHELDVWIGDLFTAGGASWRLDRVERFDNQGRIGGRTEDATISRIG